MTLRLLAVHAHPDDESSKGAATLARYAAEGVRVRVATCTGGERGDVLNPHLDDAATRHRLPQLRRTEMARAAAILGVEHEFLGFTDSGLPADGEPLPADGFALVPDEVAVGRLTALLRRFRPHVVITYDPSGGYPHPDHVRTHEVTVAAFDAAADAAAYPDAGPAWRLAKLYYLAVLSPGWFAAMHRGMLDRGVESAMGPVLAELDGVERLPVTTRIECAGHFATRDAAARAHATQMGPDHPFFAHPRWIEREVWQTEDYQLARSSVDSDRPETDLFAGLR